MKKILLVYIFLFSSILLAQKITYSSVHAMPKSIEKDYYIWRLLGQNSTSRAQAITLGRDIKRSNKKLRTAYANKTGLRLVVPKKKPRKTQKELLRKKRLVGELKRLFASPRPFAKWLSLPAYKQVELFNSAGKNARKKLNHTLSRAQYNKLSQVPQFNQSINYINVERLGYLKKALSYAPAANSKLDYKHSMKLGFQALSRGDERLAASYFSQAIKDNSDRENQDSALFWSYKLTKNYAYIKRLLKSYDINIYTLAARDIANVPYPTGVTPALPANKQLQNPSYLEPIYWASIKAKAIKSNSAQLTSMAKQYRSKSTIGYYTWLMARATRDTKQYFPMPYRSTIRKLPKSRQALLYAIARQESRFVPGSISTSYALGMMQIMPFLVKDLARQRHERLDYDAMFNPVIALKYSNTHLNYLNKWIQHPLFVSYAYNAGIGFTKRMLKKGNLFRARSKYDPFWSIEMLPNNEARRYGKHVLTNYIIYMNKLGVPVRLSSMLRPLPVPSKTDRFRR